MSENSNVDVKSSERDIPGTLYKETQRLLAEPVPGIKAEPDESNARYFHVVIAGPQDSPFEGGTFKLELFLPEEYPMAAPKILCMDRLMTLQNLDRIFYFEPLSLPSYRTEKQQLLQAAPPGSSSGSIPPPGTIHWSGYRLLLTNSTCKTHNHAWQRYKIFPSDSTAQTKFEDGEPF
ncbi:hypothetical protein A6R68_05954 [Neotoma lepida]|uniref:UBC core domain-containing protein n=1 Tax=Neotoma lepida TaxID=56216 RepID=A0A1A6GJJ9_NEOLE|nr:hypothetical protein A6R68_05954 [Neotoma lepida]